MEMVDEHNIVICYLAVGSRRLSVFLSMMQLPVKVLEHVLVAFLCVHYFLEKIKKEKNLKMNTCYGTFNIYQALFIMFSKRQCPNNIYLKVQLSITRFLSLQRKKRTKKVGLVSDTY